MTQKDGNVIVMVMITSIHMLVVVVTAENYYRGANKGFDSE